LGGQGVPQLVCGDVADAGCFGQTGEGFGDAVVTNWPVVFE
jgi:hypothetical protein